MNDTPAKPDDPSGAVQGEGDYASARKYNEQAREFARSGKVERAAEDAAPRTQQEQDDMLRAEAEGRSHAKGQPNAGRQTGGKKPESTAPDAPPQHPEGQNPSPEKIPGR